MYERSTRDDEESDVVVERTSPERVFALLGDDTRIAILQALGETPEERVPFGELHDRVGIRDSGQFNYHLGKLRGSLVRRTDEGYELTFAGRQIVGAMHAGTYTANASVESFLVDGSCLLCGGTVVASYAHEKAVVECSECEGWRNEIPFPPGSLEQFERDELPHAFDRWLRNVVRSIVEGFCYNCAGRMVGELVVEEAPDEEDPLEPHVRYRCDRCGTRSLASIPLPALFHPAVAGFLFDQGIDLTRVSTWQISDIVDPNLTVRTDEPIHAVLRFEGDTEVLEAVMEADTGLGSIERTPITV